jgi:hypothetical protein
MVKLRTRRCVARAFAVTLVAIAGLVFATPGLAKPVTFAQIVNATDFVQAGVAGVGSDNSVNITVSGVSGTIRLALLYYHGIGNPGYAPAGVTFNGAPVAAVNIGDSSTNCWGSGSSSAYRANVTAQVVAAGGNATYAVNNLANGAGLSANGASLIIFFNDANAANNRDVALFEGNDSDISGFPGDPSGWQATLSGINYTSGTAGASFHVGDGQSAPDGNVTFTATPNNGGTNPLTIVDNATIFDGVTVPDNGSGRIPGLWDINTFDITGLFNNTAGTYTIDLTHPQVSDCLALIVLALDFQAGALPGPDDTTKPSCAITATGTDASGRKFIEITVEDNESGLASIQVTKSTNANTVVPPFAPGTNDPVVVRSTKIDQSKSSTVELRVTDVAGNVTICDPVIDLVIRERGEPANKSYTGLPAAEHFVTITNGDPGVQRIDVTVNGQTWKLTGLRDNEVRTLDVASAMVAGNNNTIRVKGYGRPGGQALIVIADT